MVDQLDVSVVICVLNGAEVIGEQLDALSRQTTDLRWEVVVADNGSNDDTAAVVEQRAPEFPVPLRVVDASVVPGVGAARNVGVLSSRGRAVAFCDCDDRVSEGWVQAAHDGLETFAVVAGLNRELRSPFDADAPVTNPGCVVKGSFGNAAMGGNAAFRRETFLAAGGFDTALPRYGIEDFELAIRVNKLPGVEVGPAPDMLLYFRPTTDKRVLLRKVYMAACGEVFVWHRHSDMYGDLYAPMRLIRRAAMIGPDIVMTMVRSRKVEPQKLARLAVTRVANLVTEARLRTGRDGLAPAELIHDAPTQYGQPTSQAPIR